MIRGNGFETVGVVLVVVCLIIASTVKTSSFFFSSTVLTLVLSICPSLEPLAALDTTGGLTVDAFDDDGGDDGGWRLDLSFGSCESSSQSLLSFCVALDPFRFRLLITGELSIESPLPACLRLPMGVPRSFARLGEKEKESEAIKQRSHKGKTACT